MDKPHHSHLQPRHPTGKWKGPPQSDKARRPSLYEAATTDAVDPAEDSRNPLYEAANGR